MQKLSPCFDKVKGLSKEDKEFLEKRVKELSALPDKEANIRAAKELQDKTLDDLHNVYHQLGIEGYENNISSSKTKNNGKTNEGRQQEGVGQETIHEKGQVEGQGQESLSDQEALTGTPKGNKEGAAGESASSFKEISSETHPEQAAKALRESAQRLADEGDREGAMKLFKQADRIESGKPPPEGGVTDIEGSEPSETTSIANKVVNKERIARGLDPIQKAVKRAWKTEVLKDANEKIDSGAVDPQVLARELNKKPRPLTDTEDAILAIGRMQLWNAHKNSMSAIEEAVKSGDKGAETVARMGLTYIEDAMYENDIASKKSGTENARGLAARRMMIANDYSLANQKQRLRVANMGKPLPKELNERLEKYSRDLEEANRKLDEHQKRISELEAGKISDKIKRDAEFEERKEKRATVKERIQKERTDLYDELKMIAKDQSSKLSSIPVPVEMIPTLAKLARNYAKEGITELSGIADKIHENLKDFMEGITKEDVKDALLKYNDEKKLEEYKKRLVAKKGALEERIENKDFEPRTKTPTPLDREAMMLQADVENVKRKFDTERIKLEKENRTKYEKTLDFISKWYRMDLLSGITVLGKLTSAAQLRMALTPLEEGIGGVLSHIPGISSIAAQAPREGGFNIAAEAKAVSQYIDKATYNDMWDMIKKGKNPMELIYGKKYDLPAEALGFFGQLHSALKVLPKRAEFYRSFEKRYAWAKKNGLNADDPLVQTQIASASYNDASRAIFMQDNMISNAYKLAAHYLDNLGNGGKAVAFGMKTIMPIIKVPTNIVGEAFSYAGGGVKAAVMARKQIAGGLKMMLGLKKGIDKLTPDQADMIMRNLKKQTIGAAFFALGYFGSASVGGYYTGKREEDEVEEGGLRMFGVDIPKWMVHNPALEMLQLGATVKKVHDKYEKAGKDNAAEAGALAGFGGLAGQLPFIDNPKRIVEAWKTPKAADKYADEFIRSITIPQLIQEAAKLNDKDEKGNVIKRKPDNLLEMEETAIPGLRQKVHTTEEFKQIQKEKAAEKREERKATKEQMQEQ